jgi:hypothetical protein
MADKRTLLLLVCGVDFQGVDGLGKLSGAPGEAAELADTQTHPAFLSWTEPGSAPETHTMTPLGLAMP